MYSMKRAASEDRANLGMLQANTAIGINANKASHLGMLQANSTGCCQLPIPPAADLGMERFLSRFFSAVSEVTGEPLHGAKR